MPIRTDLIEKLSKMTKENGCTDNEVDNAKSIIEQLMLGWDPENKVDIVKAKRAAEVALQLHSDIVYQWLRDNEYPIDGPALEHKQREVDQYTKQEVETAKNILRQIEHVC